MALDWYRRSAEAGDFRGQFSYATVLMERNQFDDAMLWFDKALQGGNQNFLLSSVSTLQQVQRSRLLPVLRAYEQRLALMQFHR
ncbi:hypothetical protein D3C81_1864630 [compost metagenome]